MLGWTTLGLSKHILAVWPLVKAILGRLEHILRGLGQALAQLGSSIWGWGMALGHFRPSRTFLGLSQPILAILTGVILVLCV